MLYGMGVSGVQPMLVPIAVLIVLIFLGALGIRQVPLHWLRRYPRVVAGFLWMCDAILYLGRPKPPRTLAQRQVDALNSMSATQSLILLAITLPGLVFVTLHVVIPFLAASGAIPPDTMEQLNRLFGVQ